MVLDNSGCITTQSDCLQQQIWIEIQSQSRVHMALHIGIYADLNNGKTCRSKQLLSYVVVKILKGWSGRVHALQAWQMIPWTFSIYPTALLTLQQKGDLGHPTTKYVNPGMNPCHWHNKNKTETGRIFNIRISSVLTYSFIVEIWCKVESNTQKAVWQSVSLWLSQKSYFFHTWKDTWILSSGSKNVRLTFIANRLKT